MAQGTKEVQEVKAAADLAVKSVGNMKGLSEKLAVLGADFIAPHFLNPETGEPRTDLGGVTAADILAVAAIFAQVVNVMGTPDNIRLLAKVAQ